VSQIRFGLADAYTGVDLSTLSVTASIPVEGRAAGAELADLVQPDGEGIYAINLTAPLQEVGGVHLYVEVADFQGNTTRVDLKFSTLSARAFLPLLASHGP
jgi:hypothetical protein